MEEYRGWKKKFEKAGRSYNYYYYMLDSRVINKPLEYSVTLIEKFLEQNESLWKSYDKFLTTLTRFTDFLDDASHAWNDITGEY